jgi:hypothetical protein
MQRVKRLSTLLLIGLWLTHLFASGGKISGRVTDATTGEPLPGANVIIEAKWEFDKAIDLTNKQGASADAEGYFFILNIEPGYYTIKASMIGYTPLVQTQVQVNIDRTINVNFALKSSAIEMDAVEVVAQREVIRPDISGTQEIITTDRLSDTPVMRVDEFVDNIKGVDLVSSSDGNGLSIRGGGIRETDVRVDGISTRDPRSENAYLSLNSTSVAELQVLTGGFEAKYGSFRSGLVNVVTKEGERDRYTVSFKVDYTPSNDYKFFGTNPWSSDSWIYKVYADTTFGYTDANGDFHSFCMDGVVNVPDSLLPKGFPDELKTFKGWKSTKEGRKNYPAIGLAYNTKLTAEQKRRLWLIQHPQYQFANKPDVYAEGTITGPVPGKWIPLLGNVLEKSTFLLAGKYEDTQFAFPIGPRDSYLDYNTQLKITTQITPKIKITLNGLYAQVKTNTTNSPSSMGGALIDNSSRFGFLSSTQQSTYMQADILGSGDGYLNMYNKSRLLYYDQRWLMGGVKFSQAISSRAFQTLELQFAYQDNEIYSFAADTSETDARIEIDSNYSVYNYPTIGTPNSSTNFGSDLCDLFTIYGGLQQADSSYSWTLDLNYNLTAQIGRNHQFETGFNFKYGRMHINSGTWAQAEKMWTPDTWQYMNVSPVEMGVYLQDKLEFQGMIANVGLRGDYFTPNKDAYIVELPFDEDYADFYNLVYQYLAGDWGSWERWVKFRELLDDPPGWPKKKYNGQFVISPRLGVSFPITVKSKLYFNYGHFYQRPNVTFLYNMIITDSYCVVPSSDLEMAKTVSYEFGYEQRFLKNFLFNVSLYYKDVKDEPLSRTYVDYWEEFSISQYSSDAFSDTRGAEIRLEKNYGRFMTFWANYEYMLQSWGQTGYSRIYENKVTQSDVERSANVSTTEPAPKGNLNLNLHTPNNWGFSIFNTKPLSRISANLMFDWEDGGRVTIDEDPITGEQRRIEVVDYSNLDLRFSKAFKMNEINIEFVATIFNALNEKRLNISGMSVTQYNRYKDSLHLPWEEGEQHGHDKWGEYNKDHIDTGWFTAPLFLNPRRILIGFRVNF